MGRTNQSLEMERAFRSRVEELGGVVQGDWIGLVAAHGVRCAVGHEGAVKPRNVLKGYGICKPCGDRLTGQGSTRDSASFAAEKAFRDRVEELGGVVLEETWKGVKQPHRVRCPGGHETSPRPQSVNIGNGICERCGQSSKVWTKRFQKSIDAEAAFKRRLKEFGATPLEDSWKGSTKPHRVRCCVGHDCTPIPRNIASGQGLCLTCTWSSQDVLYLVHDRQRDWVKFGITSGNPRPRLWSHAKDGFRVVVALHQGLPEGVAHAVEQGLIRKLRARGISSTQGREYFNGIHLSLILDLMNEGLR